MQSSPLARASELRSICVHWTAREGIAISDVTEDLLKRFRQHVERCRCPGFGPVRLDSVRGDRLFVDYLRSTGSLTASVEPNQDPPLLVAFRQWMRQERGTCDRTLYNYGFCIQALLRRLGDDPRRFDAQSLRQFVLETHRQSGWAVAKKCTTALRMFLRFLIAEGQCAASLEAAIPVLAHWRLSSLPRYLLPEDVERVIASCDPSTPVGRRDRAILLLLARMGLRAGDIVQLRLGDIDWKEATVRVSGKGRRETRLPLTQEVGDAIVDLPQGRPSPHRHRCAVPLRSRAVSRLRVPCYGVDHGCSGDAQSRGRLPESRGGPCAPPFCGNRHAAARSVASGDCDRPPPPLHRNDSRSTPR